MGRLDPEVYANARVAADALKAELEPLILGRKAGPLSCSCGQCSHGKSTAIEVVPAGLDARYEDQIGLWDVWSVHMRDDDSELAPGDYSYSVGLRYFVDPPILIEMFQRHFAGIGVRV